jgi:hypothetical protein
MIGANPNLQDRILKLIDIWERGNLLRPGMLSSMKNKANAMEEGQ